MSKYYRHAEKITLVMDNLNTHKPGSLYEVFPPEQAKQLRDRFDFVYTPKHGSWLNMAEIELNALNQAVSQPTDRRIGNDYCRSRSMAESQEHAKCDNQLAVYNQRCTYQAAQTLSNITCVT